jgi:eukaryotic-like serine/threonine-protein kinase
VVGELIADRYELEELCGSGGMSSVYRAHDRLLERSVALKILHEQFTRDEDYVERFRREARAVAQLAHPNIVTVIDRGEQDGRQFIVFEYVDGENLKEYVDREGPLPVRDAIELTLQVARGLSFAHEQGLVHRDVKPQNVLLDGDGRAKVTDFGIAHAVDVDGMTVTGTIMGTSNYIAPEQASGQPVDEQTDVYSLGCVLYELLTGDVPFEGDSFVAVAMKHVNHPIPSVAESRPDVPPRLDWAIQQAMAKDHSERFGSMADFAAELEACYRELDGEEGATMIVPAPTAPRRRPAPARKQRRWSIWPAVLLGVALAALVGGVTGALVLRDDGGSGGGSTPSAPVRFTTAASFDPDGDDREHNEAVQNAIDRNPSTSWMTEHYESFTKPGVGLVVGAARSVKPKSLTIGTDTPGFTAQIKAGDSAAGPFRPVSGSKTVTGTLARFNLSGGGRYFLVWITDLGGHDQIRIDTVRAR